MFFFSLSWSQRWHSSRARVRSPFIICCSASERLQCIWLVRCVCFGVGVCWFEAAAALWVMVTPHLFVYLRVRATVAVTAGWMAGRMQTFVPCCLRSVLFSVLFSRRHGSVLELRGFPETTKFFSGCLEHFPCAWSENRQTLLSVCLKSWECDELLEGNKELKFSPSKSIFQQAAYQDIQLCFQRFSGLHQAAGTDDWIRATYVDQLHIRRLTCHRSLSQSFLNTRSLVLQ